jgi:hypothetical protein
MYKATNAEQTTLVIEEILMERKRKQNGKVQLKRVVFHDDKKSVSYRLALNGHQRIVTYKLAGDERLEMDVREKRRRKPFIQVLVENGQVQARTPEGVFELQEGRHVLPESTDRASLWALAQNFVQNPTLRPDVILDWVNQDLVLQNEEEDTSTTTYASWGPLIGIPGAIWAGILIWEWLGGEDCLNPNQKGHCTETDPSGNETTVEFQCECGTPMCQTQTVTVDVPVIIVDSSTGEQTSGIETRSYTKCICYCMEMHFPKSN